MAKPLRWGILSTARIGRLKVVPGMKTSPLCHIVAVASRDEGAATAMASELGIARAYGSYEALLADREVEAIYNPLPNHLHVPLTLAAARAGKHVLCEKPIAITAAEAAQLRQVPDGIVVEEAFMVRHHPQWLMARERIRSGAIGTPRAVQVAFSYLNTDPANIRNKPEIGGGALLDIGCYAVVAGRFLFDAEPLRVMALIDRDPVLGIDRTTSGLVDFGEGRQLSFSVSTQAVPYQRLQAYGTAGRLEIEIPFNAPPGEVTRIRIDDGSKLAGSSASTIELPPCDQYGLQGEAFARVVRGEEPGYGIEDAIRNMRILDALLRSDRSGQWEVP